MREVVSLRSKSAPFNPTRSEYPDTSRAEPPAPPMVMPGNPDEISKEISRVGVEGTPADPKVGPGAILLGLGTIFAGVVIAGVIVSITVDVPTALMVFGIGCLALVFNPLVWASLMRARERQGIVEDHEAGAGGTRRR